MYGMFVIHVLYVYDMFVVVWLSVYIYDMTHL